MSALVVGQLVIGLVLLIGGAEVLVRGASALARLFGVSPLVVGLTVVAYGTGSPELAVSALSSLRGEPDLGLGNVLGSNIANVLVVLGSSALVAPLLVSRQLVRLDVPVMVVVTAAVYLLALDGTLSRPEGIVLIVAAVAYTVVLLVQSRRNGGEAPLADEDPQRFGWLGNTAFVVVGLVLLVLGSRWLVASAVVIAEAAGVSELVIGLTVVAVGTSLPEVATSLIAAFRGERDIAVGNIVGSNIFNLLAVLGVAATLAPGGMSVPTAALGFDFPVVLAVSIACLPIFFSGHRIGRREGGMFVTYYIAYIAYVVLAAQQHDALPLLSAVMLWFVIPLTVVSLSVIAWRSWRGDAA